MYPRFKNLSCGKPHTACVKRQKYPKILLRQLMQRGVLQPNPVYYVRMKLNGARILDYPYLWQWLCRVYAMRGVADAGSLIHCRQGCFGRSWNGTIPLGPMRPMPYLQAYLHHELAQTNP